MQRRIKIGLWSAVAALGLCAGPLRAESVPLPGNPLGLTDPKITVQMVNPNAQSNLPEARDVMTVEPPLMVGQQPWIPDLTASFNIKPRLFMPVAGDAGQVNPGDLVPHNQYGSNTRPSRSTRNAANPPAINSPDNRSRRTRASEQQTRDRDRENENRENNQNNHTNEPGGTTPGTTAPETTAPSGTGASPGGGAGAGGGGGVR